jgi:hypothetical protein
MVLPRGWTFAEGKNDEGNHGYEEELLESAQRSQLVDYTSYVRANPAHEGYL